MKMRLLAKIIVFAMVLSLAAGCNSTSPKPDQGSASAEKNSLSEETSSIIQDTSNQLSEYSAESIPTISVEEESSPTYTVQYPLFDNVTDMTVMMGVGMFLLDYLDDESGLNKCYAVQKAEEATNVHMNFQYMRQGLYGEQLSLILAGGDYPDILACPETYYSGGIDSLVDDEICIDIAPYIEEYAPDFASRLYHADEEYAKEITSDTGKITTIWVKEDQYSTGTQIRKDWLDKLGLDIPKTYDELDHVLAAFKNDLGVRNAVLLPSNLYVNSYLSGGLGVAGSIDTFAGDITWQLTEDGTVVPSIMCDGYRDWLRLLRGWYENGYISDDVFSVSASYMISDYVYSNDTGFFVAQVDTLSHSAAELAGGDYEAVAMADLTKTGAEIIPYGKEGGNISISGGWAITTQCEYPLKALSYINWYFTDDGYNASNYGQENVSYEYDKDGNICFTDIILNNPEGLTTMQASSLYIIYFDIPHYYSLEKKMLSLVTQAEKDSQTIWPSNRSNDLVYHGNLSVEESVKYSSLIGDIATYAEECLLKFFTGDMSIDEDYDAYIQTLKDLGIEQLIELKQAAYERYLER